MGGSCCNPVLCPIRVVRYGANPIPAAMQADWDAHGSLISGGAPYSEGIYLDMNQVMRQGSYWGNAWTNETLAAYIRYEFGWEAAVPIAHAVAILEQTWSGAIGSATSQKALDLLSAAAASMTAAAQSRWRWRILYLRAEIDSLAFNGSAANARALNASFAELDALYYVERDCCHPGGPRGCTDTIDTQINCTIYALRPGFKTPQADTEC